MSNSPNQIFQTPSTSRWQRFKWTFRFIAFLFVVIGVILTLALTIGQYNPSLPQLKEQGEQYKAILQPDKHSLIQQNKINKQYAGFRKYIDAKKWKKNKNLYVNKADTLHNQLDCPIRAAFYVPWDAQSYFSLKNNISKINMVLPEWFFIDPIGDTIVTKTDQRAFRIIKLSGVKVVPMLSNAWADSFSGAALHRIINNPAKRARLINDVTKLLKANNFQGINIDFEELKEESDEAIDGFMKDLSEKLHKEHLIVTQDVSPFNSDYNYEVLAKYCDYLFLMAYDQHTEETVAGPICAQKWIEAAIDEVTKKVPDNKIVLCLAAYGIDWPKNSKGVPVTYQEALTTAGESDAKPDFDNDTYNNYFSYSDDNNVLHDVYFTDAATNFNTMRFAAEYGLAGVSLWRLGSEDSRLWQFYNKDVGKSGVGKFDFTEMYEVKASKDVITTPKSGNIKLEIDTALGLISEEHYESLPSMFVVRKYGNAKKKVVLSFDDGPDPEYTPRILDILSREHVPAVFFLIGINAENNIPVVKRIFREGHEIGSHTFTHPNMAEVSTRRAILELSGTRLLIECITGHSTIMFRPPFNADSEPETMEELIPVALSKKYNYLTIGESIDPNDWEPGVSADSIFARVVAQQDKGNIILLHDSGGDRESTVKILPKLIKYYKDRGYTFTTVADLAGLKKEVLMPEVPKSSGYYLIQLNYLIAALGYWGGHTLFNVFVVCIVLSILRILFLAVLAICERRRERKNKLPYLANAPLVSIIVPAYNEEVNAVKSVENLLLTNYPNFNIIFIDDGSKDQTYAKVKEAFDGNSKVIILTKPNGGKASALNYGIAHSEADYVVCMDADTQLLPNAVQELMKHFADNKVGAVAGSVEVGNEVNLLTRWQSIEYITSQNFDRKAFAYLNAITVVPGAIGAFRKVAIEQAGAFTSDTFAEDCDLTIRILREGYIIKNDNSAFARTEAPETTKMFLKQRFRWTFGIMQSFWKNRDALFNWKYRWLGMIALPNILIFQILIPLVAPMADIMMIIGLLTGNWAQIVEYYFLFMLIDVAVAFMAFIFEGANLLKLVWLIPQRIIYRWLMLYVLFKAIRRAIKGELQSWGVLKRTGKVGEVKTA